MVDLFSSLHLQYWREMTVDPWVWATVSRGYTLQFQHQPPMFSRIVPTLIGDPVHSKALSQEICSLLEKGAIERVHPNIQRDSFYSTYFHISKKDGGVRPVLNLRHLNMFLKTLPFRMLRAANILRSVKREDWFTSINLKDAYFHVPIAPHHRKFL